MKRLAICSALLLCGCASRPTFEERLEQHMLAEAFGFQPVTPPDAEIEQMKAEIAKLKEAQR